jgi:hypothetical protein
MLDLMVLVVVEDGAVVPSMADGDGRGGRESLADLMEKNRMILSPPFFFFAERLKVNALFGFSILLSVSEY